MRIDVQLNNEKITIFVPGAPHPTPCYLFEDDVQFSGGAVFAITFTHTQSNHSIHQLQLSHYI